MMSFSLFLRHQPPRDTLASRIGWHTEVCPPSLRQAPRSAWARLWCWLMGPGISRASPCFDKLPTVRDDFQHHLGDIRSPAANALGLRIHQARSLRELWHLRAELYHVVSMSHSQHEAETRLARLNRHFPTRAPRSGFVPLLP